jgi:hypothetical protein
MNFALQAIVCTVVIVAIFCGMGLGPNIFFTYIVRVEKYGWSYATNSRIAQLVSAYAAGNVAWIAITAIFAAGHVWPTAILFGIGAILMIVFSNLYAYRAIKSLVLSSAKKSANPA